MGNPKILPQDFTGQADGGWQRHNGWLARVPGDVISAGSKDLPEPGASVESPRHVEIDAPDLGLVRIRYEASSYRHHRSSFWRWSAVWADKVGEASKQV